MKKGYSKVLIMSMATALLIAGVFAFVSMARMNNSVKDLQTKSEEYAQKLAVQTVPDNVGILGSRADNAQADISDMIQSVMPSVVGVSAEIVKNIDDLHNREENAVNVGSGFIVSEDGYIITNNHVIAGGTSDIMVSMSDGHVYKADKLWSDETLDLAIIKIGVSNATALNLGDVKSLRQADAVYAIGNPLGMQFQRTVTSGIVSALYRTISINDEKNANVTMDSLIQTDASINPGNSGGPLIDKDGNVVGINTIKIGSAEGIGFAIPINIVKPILQSVIKNGKFEMPDLGFMAYDKNVAQYLNQSFEISTGITVFRVYSGTPADVAGLKEGDVITHVNKKPVENMMDFREQIYYLADEESCVLSVLSNGRLTEKEIILRNFAG